MSERTGNLPRPEDQSHWMHGCELVAPASQPRMIHKALSSDADWVCLDLEDAVAEQDKNSARELLFAVLSDDSSARPRLSIRVNGPDSARCDSDIDALMQLPEANRPDALVLPMIFVPAQVARISSRLDHHEAAGTTRRMRIHLMIETAASVCNLREIAEASPRIDALILGPGDLGEDLHVRRDTHFSRYHDPISHARIQMLLVARARGIKAVDGPFLGSVDDLDGFARESQIVSQMGYDGKWAIHPSQIEPCRAAFAWPAAEVEWARRVLDLYERMAAQGLGTMRGPDGALVDAASLLTARRILREQDGTR